MPNSQQQRRLNLTVDLKFGGCQGHKHWHEKLINYDKWYNYEKWRLFWVSVF